MTVIRKASAPMLLALGIAACGGSDDGGQEAETFRNPPELRSENGLLQTRLEIASATLEIAGQRVTTTVYNGLYMPPVLRLRPGDTLKLELDNRSNEPSNEHYHGLNVAPGINSDATVSDDIFVHVDPGRQLDYRIAIPPTHPSGLYWYHSHQHGSSERQVMLGLSGGLVIDGLLDPLPQLQGVRERIMLLKDIQITKEGTLPDDIDPSAPSLRTVNGLSNPTLSIRPGETQLLRIGNIGADIYYHLRLDGHVFYELARDGNRRNELVPSEELILAPGSRSEVLIQGAAPGRYELRALAVDTGPAGDQYGATTMATLVSQGRAQSPIELPRALPAVEDYRNLPVARRRTITFTESADGNTFYIDSGDGSKQFDPNRVDTIIESGTVEEWTVLNATQELHAFHIHQTDFQITEIDGAPQPLRGHQDNVSVSFQKDAASPPGQVKLLIDFRNPLMIGRFVYHCHILEHEDGGMMAVAEVVPPGASLERSVPTREGQGLVKTLWSRLAGGGESDAERARRAERVLDAVQAGSYCRTPAPR
jgi:suppressor of ftsI